jgi:glycosyltransferase involved in cell wall biosynthesis
LLKEIGAVDVVHGHQHHFSAIGLREAARAGVVLRVAHSHLDTTAVDAETRALRRPYIWMMRRWSSRYSNLKLAATRAAAESLFGSGVGSSSEVQLLRYGIDLSGRPLAPVGRETLGFGGRDRVVIVVGRLTQQKNHRFAIEVFTRLSALMPEAKLLVLGTGPLQAGLVDRVKSLNLGDSVIFGGWRSDLPQILAGAVDLFLMPSLHEGIPLALVEAQAAGLPCLVSDAVARDSDCVPSLVHRLPLSAGPDIWAAKCHALLTDSGRMSAEEAVSLLRGSEFNSRNSARRLFEVYWMHLGSVRDAHMDP